MTGATRTRTGPATRRAAWLSLAVVPIAAVAAFGATGPAAKPDAGEAVYRRGVGSSGRPLRAVVSGDVPLTGAAACVTCHQRSGFGSFEGSAAVPPVVGRVLFSPRAGGSSPRPAYDVASLGRALREGSDPAGRTLGPLMPRFEMTNDEVEQLARYLAGLSAGPSPGVDATTLRLATVVTPDADPRVRTDTLAVLQAYVRGKNARTRGEGRPGKKDGGYREWRLDVWTLEGPEEGWLGQLERLYRDAPVFALLSGVGGARWGPVHEFCERHGIPSILPNLDVLPEAAGQGFYNLYYSPGMALEAAAVASRVATRPGAKTVQALRDGSATAEAAAGALRSKLAERGLSPPLELRGEETAGVTAAFRDATDVVLWLGGDDLARALGQLDRSGSTAALYLSSTLLGDGAPDLPPGWEGRTHVARPYALPAEVERRFRRTSAWLRSQGIAPGDARIQDQTLAACGVLGDAVMHAGRELVRDYVLELVDHGGGMQLASSYYRSLAFGPSQRILSRGCYLVPAAPGAAAPAWVVP